jgi:signal transduction histidine kinase
MARPRPIDLLLVAAATALAGVLVRLDPAAGWPELLFGAFLFSLAAYVVRATGSAGLRAWSQRRRARDLAAAQPDQVARVAIEEERRRLGVDIVTVLRGTMSDVVAEIEKLDDTDPRPALRRIHQRAQLATSELRRQLGLLRSPATPEPEGTDRPAPTPPPRDRLLAAGLTVLAAVEVTAYLLTEGPTSWLPWSPVLTALAAATVLGRTVAPGAAAAVCAVVFVVGSLVGYPIGGGFWQFGTLGCLVWVIAARARTGSLDLLGGALLVTAVLWSRAHDDPGNLFVTALLLSVAAGGGLVVGLAGHHEHRSRLRAAAREAELRAASDAAVTAERVGFARELHDVVSHAVGLIAMQAAAAQVSWPHDPHAVRRSVAVIDATARATLADLARLGEGPVPPPRTLDDVLALVARIRAAGTAVDLTVLGDLPETAGSIVHRVLQEALTNVVRHAPGATVRVTLTSDPDRVVVRVRDDGTGNRAPGTRGYGLVGLSERVAMVDGTLEAGPDPAGGFLVEAVLPARTTAAAP